MTLGAPPGDHDGTPAGRPQDRLGGTGPESRAPGPEPGRGDGPRQAHGKEPRPGPAGEPGPRGGLGKGFDPAEPAVEVFWRPGCPFCMALRAGLRLRRIAVRETNIWEDPAAAAFVRSVAGGNETVPTVVVGGEALVNPSAAQVARRVRGLGDPPPLGT